MQIPGILEGRVLACSLATTEKDPLAAAAAAAAATAEAITILVKADAHGKGTRQAIASGGRTWSLM
jgi:hypothetical protein